MSWARANSYNSTAWENVDWKKFPLVSICSAGQAQLMGSVDLVLTDSSFCWDPSVHPWTECSPSSHLPECHRAQQQGPCPYSGIPSLDRTACGEPRVVVPNSLGNCFPVTLISISLGCLVQVRTTHSFPNGRLVAELKLILVGLPQSVPFVHGSRVIYRPWVSRPCENALSCRERVGRLCLK